jgi:hypothetical protein
MKLEIIATSATLLLEQISQMEEENLNRIEEHGDLQERSYYRRPNDRHWPAFRSTPMDFPSFYILLCKGSLSQNKKYR